jgi:hypothetical protein
MGLLFWFITLGCPAEYYVRGRVLLSLKTEKEEEFPASQKLSTLGHGTTTWITKAQY